MTSATAAADTPVATPYIEARDLCRNFAAPGAIVAALAINELTLRASQFVAIQGPSGCGKSTLLNLLGLLDSPCGGTLHLAGEAITSKDPEVLALKRRQHVGFLFQDAGLIDRMTVLENVAMALEYRDYTRQRALDEARAAIALVGLAHRINALSNTLSGGERQRVGLARLFAIKPKIIICDEPTASLDEANTLAVVELLRSAADAGACVVCASHDPLVLNNVDECFVMSRGAIIKTIKARAQRSSRARTASA